MKELELWQKKENDRYFTQIIEKLADLYAWKDKGFVYRVKNGKLIGTKQGIEAIKEITTKGFHKKLAIK